jgi:AbrB family looped-hinge helix DNA binding protein
MSSGLTHSTQRTRSDRGFKAKMVRIGKRFTMVIPREARKKLGLKEGQLLEVRLEDERLIFIPKVSDPFRELSELIGDVDYSSGLERKTERRLFSKVSHVRRVSGSSS